MIKTFHTGGNRNLGYLIVDDASNESAVIDPSYDPGSITTFASAQGYHIVYAFNTHDHHDHTNGNHAFASTTGITPLKYGDVDPRTGRTVEDRAVFPLGSSQIQIIHTPGHTPDSICLLIGKALFTGDTLFVGKVGGTDLDEGAKAEYASIHDRLLSLPHDTRVFPGHDVGTAPESTLGHERETNPFLLRPTVEAFIDLKAHWAEYKKEHGIE